MATARPYWKNGVIYIAIRNREKRVIVRTGFKVEHKHWNTKAAEVRKTAPDFRTINESLSAKVAQAQSIITELIAAGRDPAAAVVAARMDGAPQPAGKTFTAYCKEVLKEYEAKGQIATWRAYNSGVQQFEQYAGDVAFEDLTPTLMRRFHTYLVTRAGRKEKGLQPNTVHKYVSALKTIYRQAQHEGLASYAENPFKLVKLRKEEAIKEKLTTEEVRTIEALDLPENLAVTRDAWMFAFYAGGMRFGDVAFFRRKYLKIDGEEVRSLYRMGKTAGIHGVLLVPEAVAILERYGWREKKPNEFVFPIMEGYDLSKPILKHNAKSSQNVMANKDLAKIAQLAGIEKRLTFHLSRHSLGGYLLEQGYDVYTIRDVLGHASVRVTEMYLRGFKGQGPDDAMRSLRL